MVRYHLHFMEDREDNILIDADEAEGTEPRIFEVGFLLVPTLTDESLSRSYEEVKTAITKRGAIISEEAPTLRNLAYAMKVPVEGALQNFKSAYFGWVKFEANQESLDQIKSELSGKNFIIRSLFIRTVRENTYFPTKLSQVTGVAEEDGEITQESAVDETEPAEEGSKEKAIDKSIEELVTE